MSSSIGPLDNINSGKTNGIVGAHNLAEAKRQFQMGSLGLAAEREKHRRMIDETLGCYLMFRIEETPMVKVTGPDEEYIPEAA